ncbi:MAG: hypothetical protein J0I20_35340 [Chloroflexi bacterium]|nr:hypothetical protein [Chloroflexota bacterium]OJV88474.1 MAG: hypothetical protein BGO39_17675 [Chloroflexi bacterium 54-19]
MVATQERPPAVIRNPLSKKTGVIVILALLLAFYLLHKVDWTEPPLYPGATVIQTVTDYGNNIKQTVMVSSDQLKKVTVGYNALLNRNDWYNEIISKNYTNFVLDDKSKTFSIFSYDFFHTQCSAFFLNVAYEELADKRTQIVVSQFVGPCGSHQIKSNFS